MNRFKQTLNSLNEGNDDDFSDFKGIGKKLKADMENSSTIPGPHWKVKVKADKNGLEVWVTTRRAGHMDHGYSADFNKKMIYELPSKTEMEEFDGVKDMLDKMDDNFFQSIDSDE